MIAAQGTYGGDMYQDQPLCPQGHPVMLRPVWEGGAAGGVRVGYLIICDCTKAGARHTDLTP